jgi:hypothetical protein
MEESYPFFCISSILTDPQFTEVMKPHFHRALLRTDGKKKVLFLETDLKLDILQPPQTHTQSQCSKLVTVSRLFHSFMLFSIYNLSILNHHIDIKKGITIVFLKVAIENY